MLATPLEESNENKTLTDSEATVPEDIAATATNMSFDPTKLQEYVPPVVETPVAAIENENPEVTTV